MKKVFGLLASVAAVVGILALATPVPAASHGWPHCKNGRYCGAPEPDACMEPCHYWEPCGAQCGCKLIPGCDPHAHHPAPSVGIDVSKSL